MTLRKAMYLSLSWAMTSLLCAGLMRAVPALAQDDAAEFYRGKTITLLVGGGAGGGFDSYARYLAPFIATATGANVIVEDRPGAGGIIALNSVAAGKQDGLLIAMVNGPAATAAQILHQEGVRYDLTKLDWLAGIASEPWVLVLKKGVTLKDLLASSASGSGPTLRWGASGKTDSQAVSAATFSEALGLRSRIIPGYRGSAEVTVSMLRGETDAMILTTGSARAVTREPGLSLVATLARHRASVLPDLPTIFEQRALSPEAGWWIDFNARLAETGRILAAPPGTPPARLQYLRAILGRILTDTAIVAKSGTMGRPIDYEPPDAVLARLREILASTEPQRMQQVTTVILHKFD